jgi:hypothetical protein
VKPSLALILIGDCGKHIFHLRRNVSKEEFMMLVVPLYLCAQNLSIWSSIWLIQCRTGGKIGSILRTRKLLNQIYMV